MRYVLPLLAFLTSCAATQAVVEHPATQVGVTILDAAVFLLWLP